MVFYRKYRPQTISDLDSTALRETLTAVLTKAKKTQWESLPHAFLFTGPKGLGKTSTARIIAKVLNCEKQSEQKDSIEPCNVCDQCISITNGSNMDILEIDAASNRGIDEIRDLKEKIRLAPARAQKKVYIIDEVHMLTTEAFNALLKTLEEPPAHAVFILCTTEPQKVPATILSRCFHVMFKPATIEELVRSFRRIADAEKIEVDDLTLSEIAKMADGGFRDGVKVLEEIVAMTPPGEKGNIHLTKEILEKEFKFKSTGQYITQLFSYIQEKNLKDALHLINLLSEEGVQIREFISQLVEKLHNTMLGKAGLTDIGEVVETNLSLNDLRQLLLLLEKVQQEMRFAVLPQLPLELMLIDVCSAQPDLQSSVVVEQITSPETVAVHVQKDDGVTVTTLKRQVGNIVKIKALYGEKKEDEEKPVAPLNGVSLMHLSDDGMPTKEWIDHFWASIINNMKTQNHTIAGVLRGCLPKSFDKKLLVIETAYKFHKDKLDTAEVKKMLEKICSDLTGKPVAVSIMLKSDK